MPNAKIKLAVLKSKYFGPVVTSVDDLAVGLDNDQFEVIFIYLSSADAPENHLEKKGHRVYYLSDIQRLNAMRPYILFRLVRILRQNKINLLHCHAHKPAFYGALAGWFLPRIKIVAHVHGLRRSARMHRKLTNFIFLGRVDRFLTVAKAVRQDLIANNWRIPPSKVNVLENSVDYDKFAESAVTKSQARQMLGIPENTFVFGTIGRLAPTKGLSYLLEAFATVKKRFPRSYLLLVGEGPEETAYRKLVISLGIQNAVCFAGYRKDIEKILQGIDVFVLSSVAEGMPRVLLEALAAGIPCIGTNVGGIPELIDEDVGLLVEVKNSTALAEAMMQFIEKDVDDFKALSRTVAEKAKNHFSHAVVMEKLKNIYYELLGQNGLGTDK